MCYPRFLQPACLLDSALTVCLALALPTGAAAASSECTNGSTRTMCVDGGDATVSCESASCSGSITTTTAGGPNRYCTIERCDRGRWTELCSVGSVTNAYCDTSTTACAPGCALPFAIVSIAKAETFPWNSCTGVLASSRPSDATTQKLLTNPDYKAMLKVISLAVEDEDVRNAANALDALVSVSSGAACGASENAGSVVVAE